MEEKQTQVTNSVTEDFPISGDPSRYVTLPVQNEKIWRMYQTTLEWFWTVSDIYLANDRENITTTYSEEQSHYILQVISFIFTSHYTTINKELFMDFMNQVGIKEASYYFGSQADAKKTHCMMYSLLLEELTRDDPNRNKEKLIRELLSMEPVRDFIRWSIQSTTSNSKSFLQRLLAFAALQGIIYPVPFIIFKWTHKQNPTMLQGLNHSNDLIWRDEKLNLSLSCLLFEYLEDDLNDEDYQHIIKEAVLHAKRLFTQTLPVSKLGMDCEMISQFIEHSADKILSDIGVDKIFNKESPFDWIEEPKTETYQNKAQTNTIVDMSASFGEAKFDTDLDF